MERKLIQHPNNMCFVRAGSKEAKASTRCTHRPWIVLAAVGRVHLRSEEQDGNMYDALRQ